MCLNLHNMLNTPASIFVTCLDCFCMFGWVENTLHNDVMMMS